MDAAIIACGGGPAIAAIGSSYNETYATKSSGKPYEKFDTGAQRDSREGKGRYDLLPCAAIRRLAGVYERGAKKYAERNWESGMSLSRCMDSGIRHAFQYLEGHRDEDHLAQAVFNLLAVIEYEERIKRGQLPASLNDLPDPIQNETKPVG